MAERMKEMANMWDYERIIKFRRDCCVAAYGTKQSDGVGVWIIHFAKTA
jgi:hypothetical protein